MLILSAFVFSGNAYADNVDYYIGTGDTIGFMLPEWDTATVYYSPNEQGTREFTTWHESLYYWDKSAYMNFYWRDASIPGDPWHLWRYAGVFYMWKTEQSLYSGSSSIEYKFFFKNYDAPNGLAVRVSIQ